MEVRVQCSVEWNKSFCNKNLLYLKKKYDTNKRFIDSMTKSMTLYCLIQVQSNIPHQCTTPNLPYHIAVSYPHVPGMGPEI